MNKTELIEVLSSLAEEDLTEDADIHEHPASVAIKALNQCFDDIEYLKGIINNRNNPKSKKSQVMIRSLYRPEW